MRKGTSKLRVVTWNCRGASAKNAVWDYLLGLNSDVAFLQEVGDLPKTIESRYSLLSCRAVRESGELHRFKNAVLVRGAIGNPIRLRGGAPWMDAELDRFAGNLVGLELQPDDGPTIKAICVYNPYRPVDRKLLVGIDLTAVRLSQKRNIWVGDLLWAALCLKKPQPNDPWIVAGDFNLCESFDKWSSGNREYLARISQLGLVDCLRSAKGGLTPTFRKRRGGSVTSQIDYLFVTEVLRSRMTFCDVGPRERVFEGGLSDHLPIIADFAWEKSGTPN